MKVIEHIKKGNISYVSHIDSMRVLQRTLIRANINVKLSEGFNPHPVTYTSHPLPLGVESEQEFFVIANDDMSAEQVLNAFNNNIPSGMLAVKCYDCIKNPNFAKNVNYCEYLVKGNFLQYKKEIENFQNEKCWVIKYDFKGTEKEQDIAPLIHSLKVDNKGLVMIIATGNPNLRPDRVVSAICDKLALSQKAFDIVRTKQLVINNDKILTAEEFLQEYIK